MAAGSPISNKNAAANISTTQAGPVLKAAAVADQGAVTAYTAHAAGAVPVTSNAATDLDTTAAGLATAVTQLASLRAKVNDLLAKLRTSGILTP